MREFVIMVIVWLGVNALHVGASEEFLQKEVARREQAAYASHQLKASATQWGIVTAVMGWFSFPISLLVFCAAAPVVADDYPGHAGFILWPTVFIPPAVSLACVIFVILRQKKVLGKYVTSGISWL